MRKNEPEVLEYWKTLVEADQKASQDFDKAVMALAGGALGLSISFITNLVPGPATGTVHWIRAAWMLLTVSLLSTLFSFLASQRALRKEMTRLQEAGSLPAGRAGGKWSIVTHICNYGAAALLVIGLCCLVRFASLNYREVPNASNGSATAHPDSTQRRP